MPSLWNRNITSATLNLDTLTNLRSNDSCNMHQQMQKPIAQDKFQLQLWCKYWLMCHAITFSDLLSPVTRMRLWPLAAMLILWHHWKLPQWLLQQQTRIRPRFWQPYPNGSRQYALTENWSWSGAWPQQVIQLSDSTHWRHLVHPRRVNVHWRKQPFGDIFLPYSCECSWANGQTWSVTVSASLNLSIVFCI